MKCPKSADGQHEPYITVWKDDWSENCQGEIRCLKCDKNMTIADVEAQARQSEREKIIKEIIYSPELHRQVCRNYDAKQYEYFIRNRTLDDVKNTMKSIEYEVSHATSPNFHDILVETNWKLAWEHLLKQLNSLRKSGGEGKC